MLALHPSRPSALAGAVLLTAAAGLCSSPAGAHPPIFASEAQSKKAVELVTKAQKLASAGKLDEARAAYVEAWSTDVTFTVGANFGDFELRRGNYRDAAHYLAYAVRWPDKDADPGILTAIKLDLEEAKKHVCEVRLRSEPTSASAHFAIDGAAIDSDDLFDTDDRVFLDPGAHRILGSMRQYVDQRLDLDCKAGDTRDMTMKFVPIAAPSPLSPPFPPAAPPPEGPWVEPREKSGVALALGFGGAVAAAGAGIGFAFLASSYASGAADDRKAVLGSSGPGACASPSGQAAAVCGELSSAVSSQTTYTNVAIGSFIAAGVLALGTGAYAVWPAGSKSRKATRGVHVEPLLTGDRRGFVAVGSF
jgi:hypothetical protein